ncbi:hypothetical protein [Thiocystis violacea]|uniref:hypothetical protein n=1 Tax=Thiocystis violacea TaxID=13725 RepID=UPI001902D2C6|nr:hypothetical protein [Thiocystis violacea]MBK1719197.1 hypothetical protein [Thiocystis violacea]
MEPITQSHLIHHVQDGIRLLIYDTVTDGKHLFTACGLGQVKKGEARLTDTATATLLALSQHVSQALGEVHAIRFHEIATRPAVPVRLRKALAAANHEDLLFFICRTPDIYDDAVRGLNVQWLTHQTLQ